MKDKFYMFDTTLPKPDYVLFETLPGLVGYLENWIQRAMKKTRSQFMYEMAEVGHGYDDPAGASFTQLLSEYVNIGIVQHDGRIVKCDVHRAVAFNKEEFGH